MIARCYMFLKNICIYKLTKLFHNPIIHWLLSFGKNVCYYFFFATTEITERKREASGFHGHSLDFVSRQVVIDDRYRHPTFLPLALKFSAPKHGNLHRWANMSSFY